MSLTHRALTVFLAIPLSAGLGAQAKNACGLLKPADFQTLASGKKVKDGVVQPTDPVGEMNCQYEWGSGSSRYFATVTLGETARVWPGMSPAMIKMALSAQASPQNPGSAAVPGVGDVSIYLVDGPTETKTMTVFNGHLLMLTLLGPDSPKSKDALIAVTKLAVSKLPQ
jgi:hypothetical protein